MVAKILGAQRDFSYGEVDVLFKRADEHPARKAGLRQMVNARILNSGALQNRSGRSALYLTSQGGTRTERILISAGKIFDLQFAPGRVKIINSAGVVVANFTLQGNGNSLLWNSAADIQLIDYTIINLSIYITFAGMRPQVITFDGVSAWTIADYLEIVTGGKQKRTPFYRLSPQGITLQPSAQTGVVTLTASSALFVGGMVGTRMRFVNRQMLITAVSSPTSATATVQEPLPGAQALIFSTDPSAAFAVGDVVIGSSSGSKGVVTAVNVAAANTINVQLLSNNQTVGTGTSYGAVFAFVPADNVTGPGGSMKPTTTGVSVIQPPQPCTVWDDEVMNDFRGYPASCFTDQYRIGFCNFPQLPGGISWSSINAPTDLYVGPNPSDAMFEIVPGKAQVYFVIPGPESNEFVFCDRSVYYIPISPTNPLKPGSVQFLLLSGDGVSRVKPRISQEAILYVNSAQTSIMAVIATGAYLRPFNTKNLSKFHFHLFNAIQCIAVPSSNNAFTERYVYVLNGDGTIAVGKYDPLSLEGNQPVIGWGPWNSAGSATWIAANSADLIFSSSYFGVPLVEILDDTQYVDCALQVNAMPAAFAPTVPGQGPFWFIPGRSVTLIDQVTRVMGTYQIDANGFIVPQNLDGENLKAASLVAGQPWTMTVEPFVPDANPGQDVGQRMFKRRVARFAAAVIHSTGFIMARLFSGAATPTSPAPGTVMNFRRFPAWNQGDDPTKPPPQREIVERTRPIGRSFDPRVAVIKDVPGPLQITELGIETTI